MVEVECDLPLKLNKRPQALTRPDGKRIKYHDFGFTLAFAVTFHKIQGKTMNKLILDLNQNPQVPFTLQTLYVGISRVRSSCDLRLLPPLSSSAAVGWPHLHRLKHNADYLNWLKCYQDSVFSDMLAQRYATKPVTTPSTANKSIKTSSHNKISVNNVLTPSETYTSQILHSTSVTSQPSLFINQTPADLLQHDQLNIVLPVDVQLYLRLNNLTVIPAQPDGHCIMHAWSITTGQSLATIKDIVATEYSINKNFYSKFAVTEKHLSSYLSHHEYALQSVDTVINILCNATNTTAVIIGQQYLYTQDLHDSTLTHVEPVANTTEFRQIKPVSGLTTNTIFLLKTASHYDAIILPNQ